MSDPTTTSDTAADAKPSTTATSRANGAANLPAVVHDPSKVSPALIDWDDNYRDLVKRTVLKPKKRAATNTELALFAEQVQRTGLSPFLRQIYGIYRFDKAVGDEVMQVQVGIDGFRLVAERTGKYEGQTPQQWCGPDKVWHEVWTDDAPPVAARVGVYKRGRREPTYAVAHWREYVQSYQGKPSGKWRDMKANQLSKCAEALALRKSFPAELSGLYTPEEMAQAENAALGEGTGDGKPLGTALGEAVEAVMRRADELGVAALGHENVGTIEMLVSGADRKVDPRRVAIWVRDATAELDALPRDAEVVEAQEAPVSATAAQTANPPWEAQDGSEAPAQPSDATQSAAAIQAEAVVEDIEVTRRRAMQMLDAADAADAAENCIDADRLRDEAGVLMEICERADAGQEAFPL